MQHGNNNTINKQTLPKWLVVWWWVAIISAIPFYLRILWEYTWLTWTHGPQNVGFSIIHNHIEFFIFGLINCLLVFAWILSVSIYFLVKRKYPTKRTIFYFAIPLVAIALGFISILVKFMTWLPCSAGSLPSVAFSLAFYDKTQKTFIYQLNLYIRKQS
jgi:hypothetical protein